MSKREKLNLLREKVNVMQRDLQILEKRSPKLSGVPDILKPINKITNLKSKYSLSQTHREISFVFRESDKYFNKEPSQGQAARSQERTQTQRNLSPVLKDISNRLDSKYYTQKIHKTQEQKKNDSSEINQMYQTSYVGRRYAYNQFGATRNEIYQERKKRTFQTKRTDTLLNPPKEKETGIKIVKKIDKSPDQMLQENPNSNTKLYFFGEKPVYFWKKGSMGDKNKSSLVNSKSKGQVMPASESLQKRNRSQKKHFVRYIKEIYSTRGQCQG